MRVTCPECEREFDDEFRSTTCPHAAFPANDGNNVFTVHGDAYISPPRNLDEHNALINERMAITGFGVDVGQSLPCFFCCHPRVYEYKIMDMKKKLCEPVVCPACKRGMKLVFMHSAGETRFEVVQTEGDDPPAYLPKMRRTDA